MIPALIIRLLKRFPLYACKYAAEAITLRKATGLFILLFLFTVPSLAQQQTFHYYVLYKGNTIGSMYLTQVQTGNELSIKVTSAIQMRMLASIRVKVSEEVSYKEDRLMYSSVYRKVNGKEKVNRQTKYDNGNYEVVAEGKKGTIDKPVISYNLARLYCKEPADLTQVYSDALQQFLDIKALGSHKYKLELPDGSYNVYHYQDGICSSVYVHNPLYTIQMQLARNSIF